MKGMADSPTAIEISGANVSVTKVLVFCMAAAIAAVGGALSAVAQQIVSASSYQPLTSLIFFVAIAVVLGPAPWNALIAAGALFLLPTYVNGTTVTTYLQLIFGVVAVATAIAPDSAREVPESLQRLLEKVFSRPGGKLKANADRGSQQVDAHDASRLPVAPGELRISNLGVRYGGVRAVSDVSMTAATGRITGLIGPNGAGKTTIFNACSGLVRDSSGSIVLDAHNLSHRGPAYRARRGLGRTFQRMELFDSLSVQENVAIGVEAALAGANPLTHLSSRRGNGAKVREAVADALRMCDLVQCASVPAGSLSTGQRRLVELARALAGDFRILLLDEPSSGLDRQETEQFGRILKTVVEERGVGVLLVEHDMSLVLDICEQIYVLDFGELIFEGSPLEVIGSPVVRAAYLGDAEALGQELDGPTGVKA
jgi:ABC-type branched-subunit amino acid transport system ATPase component